MKPGILIKSFFILLGFVLFFRPSPSQVLDKQGNDYQPPKDTLCFKYKFDRGDTLIYKVMSYDSIVINYGKPLLKVRMEVSEIVCDSISRKGHYFLSQKLLVLKSKESSGTQTAERNESAWVGKKAWFEIDSVGKRYATGIAADTSKSILSPGGAFQPFLLINIGESCKAEKQSWLVDITEDLPENGYPVPVLKQTSLFRADTTMDTLSYKVNRLNFVKTAIGKINMLNGKDTIGVSTTINSYGVMDISTEHFVPVHYFMTEEQKLKITNKGDEQPGYHFITSYFTLLDIKHSKVDKKPLPPVQTKKKIRKK